MDPSTQQVLSLSNPWLLEPKRFGALTRGRLPDVLIPRAAAARLSGVLRDTRKAHLVIGPRQAGKSTLVWATLRDLDRPVLYLDCEEVAIRTWCTSPTVFAAEVAEWSPPGGVLFFEEAQWLHEPGLFLKGLVDARLDRTLAVTGSASFHLLARTRESLAGRATRHRLWPLSLAEVIDAPPEALPAVRRLAAQRALERHIVVGGYPDAWTAEQPKAVLDELVGAFVLRDASDRFRIARPDAFRTLLRLVAGQVGDLISRAELAQVLGIAATTVDDYLGLLEETHILRRIRPFAGGKRAELTKTPKPYFVDPGLRNALIGNMSPLQARADFGKLLESWVFSELHKAFPEPGGVRFWRSRSGAEVDFVLEPRPNHLLPLEVKAGRGQLRLPRAARSFIEAYAPERFIMVYRGERRTQAVGNTEVEWLPVELLPDRLAALTGRNGV